MTLRDVLRALPRARSMKPFECVGLRAKLAAIIYEREGVLDRFPTTTTPPPTPRTAANVTSPSIERIGGGSRYAATVPAGPKRTRFFPEFPPMTLTAQRDNTLLPPPPPPPRHRRRHGRTLARPPDVRPPSKRVLFPPWKAPSVRADYSRGTIDDSNRTGARRPFRCYLFHIRLAVMVG